MGYLRPKSGLRKKNVYFGVESKMATKHEFYLDLFGFIINILCCSLYNNMIYWNQEQKEIKKWLAIKSTMIYTR